ncbi:MAG: acetate--CoA ligase family protein [Chloroflexota bacterium]
MKNPENLRRLLNPKSIVVIGGSIAAEVIRQLDKIEYKGQIWAVNPKKDTLAGRPCFNALSELPAVPDAAYIGVPSQLTVEAVKTLAEMGAGGAVCYAAGFAEAGDAGQSLQATLQNVMGEMAIIGPNCYGALNYLDGVTLWPDEHGGKRIDKGVALIGQSGNIMISLSMQQRSVPLGYLISTGNQAGLTIPEYVDILLDDERVTAVGLHIEGIKDIQAFSTVALRALRKKVPIVVLKTGASELGGQVTMSHTSSLAGSDQLYNALFSRLGIMRTHSIPQFLEALKFLSIIGPLPSKKIASISCSGGEAALIADNADALGLTFPPLIQKQADGLSSVLGEKVALSNPLDYHTYIWGDKQAQFSCFSAMLMGSQDISLKILDFPNPQICDLTTWKITAEAFADAAHQQQVNGAIVATMHENFPTPIAEEMRQRSIAPMLGIEECLLAIKGAAMIYKRQRQAEQAAGLLPAKPLANTAVTHNEYHSKSMLAEFGIPIPQMAVCTKETAVSTAEEIGYPVVLKVLSDDIVHKSDVGGVKVGLNNEDEVQTAVSQMAHLSSEFLVEKMGSKSTIEMILGLIRDPQFGLALVIGAGGILVELFKDSQILLFPVLQHEVEAALTQLKIAPLLDGYRGQPPVNKQILIDAILNLAKFGEAHQDTLLEVDINPLFVDDVGVTAVDAVIRMA